MRFYILLFTLIPGICFGQEFDRNNFGNFRQGVREKVMERQIETRIRCAYTDEVVPSEAVSLDHIVSLREAWEYGAWEWDTEKIRDFYNDTDNLTLVLSGINSQKGARKNWSPPRNKEWYYGKRKSICIKYQLACPDGDN
jgi:hypothetical protein